MNKFFQLSAASALLLSFHALPASAQAQTVEELHNDLQTAVCLNDWSDAVTASSRLIGSSEITAESRAELVNFRRQLQDWQATNAELEVSGCENVAVEIEVAQPAPQPSRLDWNRAAESVGARGVVGQVATNPVPRATSSASMVGDTCADFATQGEANWHYLTGTAPASLDDDGDLIACEGMLNPLRTGGQRTWGTGSSRGLSVDLYWAGTDDFYMRISTGGLMSDFTTRSFSSGDAAIRHWERYYEGRLDGSNLGLQ